MLPTNNILTSSQGSSAAGSFTGDLGWNSIVREICVAAGDLERDEHAPAMYFMERHNSIINQKNNQGGVHSV